MKSTSKVKPAPELFTVAQVAEKFQCTPYVVRTMIDQGVLRTISLGDTRTVRIPASDVANFLAGAA